MAELKTVGKPARKKDAMNLLLGKPAFVEDVTPRDCLVVKILRSPHAHALIRSINTDIAMKVPGMVAIYTYKDVPNKRFTTAGQTYPEPSPHDRLILDQRVRFVGDAVAILAGETEKAVRKAMKLIKVDYEALPAVLDPHTAKDNPVLVHPEDNWEALCPVGADNQRNLCASETCADGDVEAVLADCDVVIDHVWHTKPCQQAMMETFRTYTEIDPFGRLHVISSTQIVFHVRRILALALDIPKSKIHVEKPRIGGGFGAKQSVVAEIYPAFVTWKTGRPARLVYTNVQAAGAYRGYGATQGIFAVESAVNELADRLGVDPVKLREQNMVRQGMTMPAYYNEPANACALDRCMARCKEIFDWDAKFPVRDMGNGKVRAAGVAMAMQGSGISGVDVGSATVKLSDDGFYNLTIGAADMGTGCDTILAQMVAECMDCDLDNVAVFGADSDASPYDSGSYASSTTYVTGKAVEQACEKLKEQLCVLAAEALQCEPGDVEFAGKVVRRCDGTAEISLADLAVKSQCSNHIPVQATATHSSPVSPPPFMVGMVEIELDKETGGITVLDYKAVVDCGTPINPNLARVQTEGGIVQGIGMALCIRENSLMQYKIPTRLDMGHLQVEFESSYEPTGPFGAKSIGEIVINTPSPAIAHAVFRATGLWFRDLPITPEKVLMGLQANGQ